MSIQFINRAKKANSVSNYLMADQPTSQCEKPQSIWLRSSMAACLCLLLATVLSACGGSSGSSNNAAGPIDNTDVGSDNTDTDNINGDPTTMAMPQRTTAANPMVAGPFTAADIDYNFGRMTVRDELDGDEYETDIHGYIRYPENQPGPFPLLMFQHGRHQTCETDVGQAPIFVGDDNCPNGTPGVGPAMSYRGYDYLVESLVSNGYAVLSMDANDINDNDSSPGNGDTGAFARAASLLRHLDEFRQINADGGSDINGVNFDHLIGKLDFSKIGIMGHSRGGEGVGKTVTVNRDRDADSANNGFAAPHNIFAVFALAPTDYVDQQAVDVVYATLLPYCDGDVEDLMGGFAYDRARNLNAAATLPKYQILTMGSNHNYFNTVWTSDDWEIHGTAADSFCGTGAMTNRRDSPEEQRALGGFFMASFFRTFIGEETDFAAYWQGLASVPDVACPADAGPCEFRHHLSVHPPANARLIIDDTLDNTSLMTNNLNQNVTFTGFSDMGHCTPNGRPGRGCLVAEPTFNTAPQVFLTWDDNAVYTSQLGGLDVQAYDHLTLRLGLSHDDADNQASHGGNGLDAQTFDFIIALLDADGTEVTVAASEFSESLYLPPGDDFYNSGSERTLLNGIRIPLAAFNGVDFSQLSSLELRFTGAGSVQITDLMLANLQADVPLELPAP